MHAPRLAAKAAKNLPPVFGERTVYRRVDMDEDSLKRIAEASGRRYFRAQNTAELQQSYAAIDKLEKSEVEVKAFAKRFTLSKIEEAQRRWLTNFLEDHTDGYGCQTEAGPYLALGTTEGRAGSYRKLWLIPWQKWLEHEVAVQNLFQGKAKSVPGWVYAGMQQRELWTQSGLSLYNRFGLYECEWYDSCWHLKPRHPLMQRLFMERERMDERDLDEEAKRWQTPSAAS